MSVTKMPPGTITTTIIDSVRGNRVIVSKSPQEVSEDNIDFKDLFNRGLDLSVGADSPTWKASETARRKMGVGAGADIAMSGRRFFKSVLKRDLAATSSPLIQTDVTPRIEPFVFPTSALSSEGMNIIFLDRPQDFPRWATPSTPSGLSENTIVSVSGTESFDQMQLSTVSRLSIQLPFSRQLEVLSKDEIENEVVKQFNLAGGYQVDKNGINGNGTNQPVGLLNLSENTGDASTATQNESKLAAGFTFGATATWAKLQGAKQTVLANNADAGRLSWIVSPYTYAKWSTIQQAAGYPRYLIEDGKVGTDRVIATNSLASTNQALFGDFSKTTLAIFGVFVTIDRHTQMHRGLVIATFNMLYAFGVMRGSHIIRSEDAGNQ